MKLCSWTTYSSSPSVMTYSRLVSGSYKLLELTQRSASHSTAQPLAKYHVAHPNILILRLFDHFVTITCKTTHIVNYMYHVMRACVQGVEYIHGSEMRVHGNLKSSNVVVDGRFQCKLTDINLRQLTSGAEEDTEASDYSKMKGRLTSYEK